MLWLGCGLFFERNWVGVRVVVSCCEKIVLMLLLGCVIRSNCGCGGGHPSQVGCIIVVVQFSFCSFLEPDYIGNSGSQLSADAKFSSVK